ncbi:acyl-CoA thioesterase [Dehalogenimonas alkenigignens]|uniref:Acyl-CoA hydrolase n=1 Tax=Dehalogenimonas alkenigignens TaxID=1217799 RepID=A0A0W0GH40_9CHLR|nr:acyl-CoA thioesterase [Dehalogenimonas alkenigignens]KTB47876.1 Acyl-CoA hydrolase [Dehalogenimonas alkenigignens]PVV83927.1 acyl-CoA thioesterase [Dehalogenimonas alkenigignens]
MDHYKLILPEHLNHDGFLFGGNMLKWIDEFAYITANQEFPGNRLVTIALDNVAFHHPVAGGEIIRFDIERARLGNTSVQYKVKVFGTRRHACPETILFETRITFVSVDRDGKKQPISGLADDFPAATTGSA